ncbi:hypothetical protein CPC08DRAFT_713943 [Agrocybe pediades]|nr:hypothetical protein CPC08DRAFT_713943 [Agrocybe pediades]
MSNSLRNMRIIAIPLTRPNTGAAASTARLTRLTYYQFQITDKAKRSKNGITATTTADNPTEGEKKKGWLPEEGVVNWTTNKAAGIWAGFGKAKGGWKLKTFQFGERLVDRLEFEELALKSIDPSLAPSITKLKRTPVLDEKDTSTIPLIFPPSILSSSTALSELTAYTAHRVPRHKKGFYMWMIIAPFTAPFMVIPVIPNLPFFFCAWRSWSHYRAYKSSQYLQSLLEHDLIKPEPSEELDRVYEEEAARSVSSRISAPSSESESSSSTSSSTSTSSNSTSATPPPPPPQPDQAQEPAHTLLLTRAAVPSILALFCPNHAESKTGSAASADLYRAVEQARVRVESGRVEL